MHHEAADAESATRRSVYVVLTICGQECCVESTHSHRRILQQQDQPVICCTPNGIMELYKFFCIIFLTADDRNYNAEAQ